LILNKFETGLSFGMALFFLGATHCEVEMGKAGAQGTQGGRKGRKEEGEYTFLAFG
jgi:hypothetical protein